jgi:hypothetical protein
MSGAAQLKHVSRRDLSMSASSFCFREKKISFLFFEKKEEQKSKLLTKIGTLQVCNLSENSPPFSSNHANGVSARAASGLRCPRSCPRALCSLLTFLELFARFSHSSSTLLASHIPRALCSLLTFLELFARFSLPRALCSLLTFLGLFARLSLRCGGKRVSTP